MENDNDKEFSLDPRAFADDAQPLDLNDPKVAAEFRAHLIEGADVAAEKWEIARQIFIC